MIQNSSGALTLIKAGIGTLTLSGTNTYSGGTSITGGILSVAAGTNLGSGGISLSNAAELLSTGAAFSSSQTLVAGYRRGNNCQLDGNNATYSGAVNGNTAFNVGITGSAGTVILSGTNTYTASTMVNAGTLQAGSTTALSANSDFTVASGATLNLDGFTNAIGSLAGSGTVTTSAVRRP